MTVALDGALIADCDTTTGWTITGTDASVGTSDAVVKQGTDALIWKAGQNTDDVILEFDLGAGLGRDMTGECMYIWIASARAKNVPKMNDKDPAVLTIGGLEIEMADDQGTPAYKRWRVTGADVAGGFPFIRFFINPTVAGDIESGTLDITDIRYFRLRLGNDQATKHEMYTDAVHAAKGLIVTGGTSSVPITWADIVTADLANGWGIVTEVGDVLFIRGRVTFSSTTGTDTWFFGAGRPVYFIGERRDSFPEDGIQGNDFSGLDFERTSTGELHCDFGIISGGVTSTGQNFSRGHYSFHVDNRDTDADDEVNIYACQFAGPGAVNFGDDSTTINQQNIKGCTFENSKSISLNLATDSEWDDNLIAVPNEALSQANGSDTFDFNHITTGANPRDTIDGNGTRDFLADGWQPGMEMIITNAETGANDITAQVYDVAATLITLHMQSDLTTDLADAAATLTAAVDGVVQLEFSPGTTNFKDTLIQSANRAIRIDAAGTYDMRNITFAANDKDLKTTHGSGVVTYNVLDGGDAPTTDQAGAGTIEVINAVSVGVIGVTEGTTVKIIANETVGTITIGDIILEAFADSAGIAVNSTFNYEAAFNPSGLDVIVRARNQGIAVAAIADDGGVFTDETDEAASNAPGDMILLPAVPAVGDTYLYGHNEQFSGLKVTISQVFVQGALLPIAWQYWNGSSWAALGGPFSDGTDGYQNIGTNIVSWPVPGDWATTTINGQGPFYYVRSRLASTNTITQVPIGTRVQLDVTRYLPYMADRVIEVNGLADIAAWTPDNISQF